MPVLETVPLFHGKFTVGQVNIHADGGLSFRYDPGWLETEGNFALSVTMPPKPNPHAHEIIAPWLANLLPEGNQLASLARALGVSPADSLTILKQVGGDTAGAISIGEPDDGSRLAYEDLVIRHSGEDAGAALAAHFDQVGRRPFLAGENGVRLSLAGGQPKTVLAVIGVDGAPKLGLPAPDDRLAVPKWGAPSTIILKPDNPSWFPGIVENEAYCLTLASLIGVPAAEAGIVRAGNREALAVVRFDRRIRRDGTVARLHKEDFAQANGVFPSLKYECGPVRGLDMRRLFSTGERLPAREALKLQDQVIFNILIANADAHAKNYSILLPGGGALMAPLYDALTVLPWAGDGVDQRHAQKLGGCEVKPGDVARRHWDALANEAGLNPGRLRGRVRELIDAMVVNRAEAVETVRGLRGAPGGEVERIADLVERNALGIGDRLA